MRNLRAILTAALLLCSAGLFYVSPVDARSHHKKQTGRHGERVRAADRALVIPLPDQDNGADTFVTHTWKTEAHVEKWKREADRLAGRPPDGHAYAHGNLLLTAGITRLGNLLTATGGTQAYDTTHTRIGTGNGSTAVVIGNTDLSAAAGSANRWFQLVDTAPTVVTNVITFHATFATGDGNFVWSEFGTDQGTASGNTVTAPLLNRSVPGTSLGTKTSGSWAITETITISANWIERLLRPLPYAPKERSLGSQYSLDA